MTVLDAFRDGALVGRFARAPHGRIMFEYAPDAPEEPVSLSLPRHRPHARTAPAQFLDNLLPDNRHVRASWSEKLGVPNEPFALLGRMGEDVAGALVLMPAGQAPRPGMDAAQRASADEIADRIMALRRNPDAWLSAEQIGRARMSLAGAQGKFALAKVGDRWFWPSMDLPSTHILKPAATRFADAPELEAGSLELARRAGIVAPRAYRAEFLGQRTFMVERFDREIRSTGIARRTHIEDVAQALGRPPEAKYDIPARQVIDLLRRHAPEDEQYVFVRMLAFNTSIGNADAHAKNYSVRLDEGGVALTPIYDAIPTSVWPELDRDLAMKIAGADRPQSITANHWAKLAHATGLDPGRVVEIAQEVAAVVAGQAHDVYRDAGLSSRMLDRLDAVISAATKQMTRGAGARATAVERTDDSPEQPPTGTSAMIAAIAVVVEQSTASTEAEKPTSERRRLGPRPADPRGNPGSRRRTGAVQGRDHRPGRG